MSSRGASDFPSLASLGLPCLAPGRFSQTCSLGRALAPLIFTLQPPHNTCQSWGALCQQSLGATATSKGLLAERPSASPVPCRVSRQSESCCSSPGRNWWGGRSLAPLLPIGIDAVAFPAPCKRTLLGPDATLPCLDAKQRDAWASAALSPWPVAVRPIAHPNPTWPDAGLDGT